MKRAKPQVVHLTLTGRDLAWIDTALRMAETGIARVRVILAEAKAKAAKEGTP